MKMIFRNRALTFVIVVLAFAITSSAQLSEGGGRLAGTWDTTVSITNCMTGDVFTSFQSVGSFHQGGTFNGITAGTPPAARTPEIGVWRHDIKNRYAFRFKAFLFDPSGVAIAYQLIRHNIYLSTDAMSYVSSGEAQVFNMAGIQIGGGCSSAVATRMTVD